MRSRIELFPSLHAWVEPTRTFEYRFSKVWVRVGDRYVPEWIEGSHWGDASTPGVEWRCEVRDGAPRLVRLSFESLPDGGDIQKKHLVTYPDIGVSALFAYWSVTVESVRLGTNTDCTALEFILRHLRGLTVENYAEVQAEMRGTESAMRRTRAKRRITPALLREVAQVYRDNFDHAPTKAVEARFFVSDRQASNYVKKAREAGLLPPTERRRKKA